MTGIDCRVAGLLHGTQCDRLYDRFGIGPL